MRYFFKKIFCKVLRSIKIDLFVSNNTKLNSKQDLRANCVQMKKASKVNNS